MTPRFIWLTLLAGFALLKYLPQKGKLRRYVKSYQTITAIVLLFIAVPYAIHALRVGIYPQLERPWISMNDNLNVAVSQGSSGKGWQGSPKGRPGAAFDGVADMEVMESMKADPLSRSAKLAKSLPRSPSVSPPSSSYSLFGYDNKRKKSIVMQSDPKSLTQTGPGVPLWQPFNTIQFSWSGPVEAGQMITLIFTGPGINRIVAFVRVGLIIVLAAGMFGAGFQRGRGFIKPGFAAFSSVALPMIKTVLPVFVVLVIAGAILFQCELSRAGEGVIPSQKMLDELQQRLLDADKCFPSCADLSDIEITMGQRTLTLVLQVDAAVNTAVPLPGNARHWLPSTLLLNGSDAPALFREKEVLWMMIPRGRNILHLKGDSPEQSTFQLPLPMKPRHSTVNSSGWEVQGIQADGSLDGQIQFKRIAREKEQGDQQFESSVLPAFARVERRLLLGLVWKVETTVKRTTSSDSAMVLTIPLLPKESVTTQGVRVKDGEVMVNMGAGRNSFSWESFLEPSETILLKHPVTRDWTEIWTVDASPVFHVKTRGIPVILHQVNHRWYPTWHPWPGEEVTLTVSRPSGVEGRTLTMESSRLELRPGQRSSSATLTLRIKSSQGGQHTILLPPDVELQEITINGEVQLIRQEGRNIPLPVNPGIQTVQLKWRGDQTRAMAMLYRTPEIDLGAPSVNAAIDLHLPSDRWPLFMGSDQLAGPAVLFWSVVFVVFLISSGLAMTGLTPLKLHHWFLLGIGMAMSSIAATFVVAGWLISMDLRKKAHNLTETFTPRKFNMMQIGLAGLTFLALGSLLFAISRGLIGHPEMNITGNGSSAYFLRWYQDISGDMLPGAWVFSLPMLVYRAGMLAWALWISFGLVHILKWGWQQFCEPVMWYSIPRKPFQLRNLFRFDKKAGSSHGEESGADQERDSSDKERGSSEKKKASSEKSDGIRSEGSHNQ